MCEPGGVSSETSGARALFAVAPSDYVDERTKLAKQAKANGDKAGAAFIVALKRPAVALWAVLAAADDDELVHDAVAATTEVAEVQASGHDSAALATASQRRRASVDALVEAAVAALARWSVDAMSRRQEIRDIVDQLSRRADLTANWLDGTLRDLPEAAVGFDMFAAVDVTPRPQTSVAKPVDRAPENSAPIDELAARRERDRERIEREAIAASEQTEQAEREAQEAREQKARERAEREKAERAEAEQRVRLAATLLRAASTQLDEARAAHQAAEQLLRTAEADHAAAERSHGEAIANLDAL
jgi:hypothetical protein